MIRTSLAPRQPRATPTEEDLRAMRAAVWHRQAVAVLRLDDVGDDWLRQAVINECNRLYGQRKDRP